MSRRAVIRLYAVTFCTVLGLAAAMMHAWPATVQPPADQARIVVSDVQPVSSVLQTPLPLDARPDITPAPGIAAQRVAAQRVAAPAPDQGEQVTDHMAVQTAAKVPDVADLDCDVAMTAAPAAGAMVTVNVTAPCHGNDRVTLHHNGLMVTMLMQADGTLTTQIPALAERAMVIAAFLDGKGAVAMAEISTVPFYDRIVVQWRGPAGVQLHAREFDAPYLSPGHIWQGARGDAGRAIAGEGGFVTLLGQVDAPDALLAEVYSFPSGMMGRAGSVQLSIEAEIAAATCGTSIEAQTLEMRNGGDLTSNELTLEMPGCDAVGGTVMLDAFVADLIIAAR